MHSDIFDDIVINLTLIMLIIIMPEFDLGMSFGKN